MLVGLGEPDISHVHTWLATLFKAWARGRPARDLGCGFGRDLRGTTKALNQAVAGNMARLPADCRFLLLKKRGAHLM